MGDTSLISNKIPGIVEEIENAFFDIPFGNSKFQIENFIVNNAITPERAYRAVGLTLNAKLRALNEAKFSLAKEDVDIEELIEKIEVEKDKYQVRRYKLELDQKKNARRYTEKLINDALHEVEQLYSIFKKLPRYTRGQFEAAEQEHFQHRLHRQALGITGALESLYDMGLTLDSKGAIIQLSNDTKVLELAEKGK